MKQQAAESKAYIEAQEAEERKLLKIIAEADAERMRQKKELDQVNTNFKFCKLYQIFNADRNFNSVSCTESLKQVSLNCTKSLMQVLRNFTFFKTLLNI